MNMPCYTEKLIFSRIIRNFWLILFYDLQFFLAVFALIVEKEYGKIRVRENLYCCIFYAVRLVIMLNMCFIFNKFKVGSAYMHYGYEVRYVIMIIVAFLLFA